MAVPIGGKTATSTALQIPWYDICTLLEIRHYYFAPFKKTTIMFIMSTRVTA